MKRIAAAAVIAGGAVLASAAGVADAAPVTGFQIQPAAYGNPNGSLDLPAFRCGVELSGSGVLTVTGARPDRWGCLPYARVSWVNTATGRTGAARLSAGLHGRPPQATIRTGPGPVGLMLTTSNPIITPGFATVVAR